MVIGIGAISCGYIYAKGKNPPENPPEELILEFETL
jgi:hypothetical protein